MQVVLRAASARETEGKLDPVDEGAEGDLDDVHDQQREAAFLGGISRSHEMKSIYGGDSAHLMRRIKMP